MLQSSQRPGQPGPRALRCSCRMRKRGAATGKVVVGERRLQERRRGDHKAGWNQMPNVVQTSQAADALTRPGLIRSICRSLMHMSGRRKSGSAGPVCSGERGECAVWGC